MVQVENSVQKYFRERLARGEYIWDRVRDSSKHVNGRLLEIGCGARFTYHAEESDACGLDITPEMIKVFKARFPMCNAVVGDARKLPFRDKMFDVVILPMLLHHLVNATPKGCMKNMHAALQETRRVMRDKAVAYIRENIVYNKVLSFLLFYVTALSARLHIRIDFLEIHSDVVTFFITERMLRGLCANFRLEKLSWKKWKFWFLGKWDVEFSMVKKEGEVS